MADHTALMDSLAREAGVLIDATPIACAAASRDFSGAGGIVGNALAVARPTSGAQVAALIQSANERHVNLTPRGLGFSAGGQSVPLHGISLDMSGMRGATLHRGNDNQSGVIHCGAGTRWSELLDVCAPAALIPEALPLNLEMTVGGLLSVGGIGDGVHRTGPIASTARSLETVTAAGEVRMCSAQQDPERYAAILGGQGRFGVITAAHIAVRRAPARVRTFQWLYDSAEAWFDDQQMLANDPTCLHLEGFCWAAAKGVRAGPHGSRSFVHWLYGLHAGFGGRTDDELPAESGFRNRLGAWRTLSVLDQPCDAHARRYETRYAFMRRSGAWNQMHPWLEYFVGGAALRSLLADVLDVLPTSMGDGHRTFIMRRPRSVSFLAMPTTDPVFCFALLPAGVPALLYGDALGAIRTVDAMLSRAGGKRYLSGWIDSSMRPSWREHFGDRYEGWVAAKGTFDSAGVFRSVLFDRD